MLTIQDVQDMGKIQPLAITYGCIKGKKQMIFSGYGKEITIEGCNNVLNKLLPLCNGINRLDDIMGQLSEEYEKNSILELINVLLDNEIIINSREFYRIFHDRSMNPSLYGEELTEEKVINILKARNYKDYESSIEIPLSSVVEINSGLLEFVSSRESTWKYSSKNISFADLSGLLRVAYGIIKREDCGLYIIPHRTVPSGGALYPLEIYSLTLRDIGNLKKGLYYFQKENEFLVPIKNGDFRERLKDLLWVADETTKTATMVLFITAYLSRECKKYANRGYRHIFLEAGHLAQNVYLYCIDKNLATVELSGFRDRGVCDFLNIDHREEVPITVLLIGTR